MKPQVINSLKRALNVATGTNVLFRIPSVMPNCRFLYKAKIAYPLSFFSPLHTSDLSVEFLYGIGPSLFAWLRGGGAWAMHTDR